MGLPGPAPLGPWRPTPTSRAPGTGPQCLSGDKRCCSWSLPARMLTRKGAQPPGSQGSANNSELGAAPLLLLLRLPREVSSSRSPGNLLGLQEAWCQSCGKLSPSKFCFCSFKHQGLLSSSHSACPRAKIARFRRKKGYPFNFSFR